MTRRERHGLILQLVRSREISTQTVLVDTLRENGIDVTQSTVSRDIADLELVKVRNDDGLLIYAPPGTDDLDRLNQLRRALARWAMSIESSGNLIVIRTPSGYADPLAQVIDEASHPRLMGTLAGENTVLVVAVEGVTGTEIRDELSRLLDSVPSGS